MSACPISVQDLLGVILLGGTGTRLSSVSRGANKHLLVVQGRTLAEIALSFLAASGLRDVVFVAPPADLDQFMRVLGPYRAAFRSLRGVVQDAPRGTAHALECGIDGQADRPVVMLFGDNIFGRPQDLTATITDRWEARLFVTPSSNLQHFSVVEVSGGGRVASVTYKPAVPISNLAVTGLMQFTPQALSALSTITANHANERDIMTLINQLVACDAVTATPINGPWADVAYSPEALKGADRFAFDPDTLALTTTCPSRRPLC